MIDVGGGVVRYLMWFGVGDLGKPETVTPDTVLALVSRSQAFAATAPAMLAGEGKLKWDDKVRGQLNDLPPLPEHTYREAGRRADLE